MATWKLLGELERPVMEHLWSSLEPQTVREAHAAMSTRRTGRPRVYISSTGLGARTYIRCSGRSWMGTPLSKAVERFCAVASQTCWRRWPESGSSASAAASAAMSLASSSARTLKALIRRRPRRTAGGGPCGRNYACAMRSSASRTLTMAMP